MADIAVAALTAPVTAEQPCGPDLFMEGDPGFFNFEAQIEGVLPASFSEFDRNAVDLPGAIGLAANLCGRTRDVRVLSPYAKLVILNRDLQGFAAIVAAIATLFKERWAEVHPAFEGGEGCFRTIAVRALDDGPHTALPLNVAPLFKTRRFGAVTFRAHLLAEGKIKPRPADEDNGIEAEKAPTAGDLRTAIGDADLNEIVAARDHAKSLVESVGSIEQAFDAEGGEGTVRLKVLRAAAEDVYRFLDGAVAIRDPALALAPPVAAASADAGEDHGAAQPVPGSFASRQEAMRAIKAADQYFATHEPASPARLYLVQALELQHKSFFDALRALVPEHASAASLKLARELPLTMQIERLAEFVPSAEQPSEEPPPEAEIVESAAEESSDPPSEEGGETSTERGDDAAAVEESPPQRAIVPAGPRELVASSRIEAVRLIDGASSWIRTNDPSSPLPLLLEQARAMAGKDFTALLREVLPASALRIDE